MNKVNPFKPNNPVTVGMFAGRIKEINILEMALFQTKNNNPYNVMVTGDRGIGKSSLMMVLKAYASGDLTNHQYGKFDFMTVSIVLSDKTDLIILIKLIEANIKRELGKTESIRNFLDDAWGFVQRLKVMDTGIERAAVSSDPDILINDFAYSLAKTSKRISCPENGESRRDGILFILDEADNASDALRLGYFFKAVTELLQQSDCNNVMFVVVGLPEVANKLLLSHESSVRLFNQMKVSELDFDDRLRVIDLGIAESNNRNAVQTTITEDAKSSIAVFSEGYPHFIQQFAFSAFNVNNDNEISNEDVLKGAFDKGGAIDSIGDRYYAADYHSKIKSDEYRGVLRIMAENMNSWIGKNEIRSKFSGTEQTLSNALSSLARKKIILKNPSARGQYRLQQNGFAMWIKLFGEGR